MTMQTFLIVIWFCILGNSLGPRKRLDRITFDKRWVNAASLVVRKGAMLESSFPPHSAHGVYGPAPSGPNPEMFFALQP